MAFSMNFTRKIHEIQLGLYVSITISIESKYKLWPVWVYVEIYNNNNKIENITQNE